MSDILDQETLGPWSGAWAQSQGMAAQVEATARAFEAVVRDHAEIEARLAASPDLS